MLSIWTSLIFCCLVKSSITSDLLSATAVNLDEAKDASFGKELTLSQTTNFRLLQTERVCRR